MTVKERDIRKIIAATSARLDQVVVRDGRRVSPLAAAALVLGAGLMASACFESVALYDAPCPDDGCGYPGGSGGAGGEGGAGGAGG